ncbi:phage recombination protein Bet [uncultured Alsobacter sp.]|uniref:phage recombination protein Bet n=1 Tax=uncultured Alsobacter sp. TaxID=1748258 RepID=UPI0025EFDA95|nr:phage recombination protein Bet [uncultured Alsobacter sp.]
MSAERNLPAVRLPYDKSALTTYQVDEGEWKVLTEAIFPMAQSAQAVIMALGYCRARNLDIFKKPVHVVPMWSSEKQGYIETVWPGISEVRTTAFRTKQYAGIDEAIFGPDVEQTFTGTTKKGTRSVTVRFPEWCRMTVHRVLGEHTKAFVGPKVYWTESYARVGNTDLPNDMWAKRPRGQLEKVAEAAALRRAFPEELGNDYTAEEMEGQQIMDPAAIARDVTPAIDGPPAPPAALEDKSAAPPTAVHVNRQTPAPTGRTDQAYGEMGQQQAAKPQATAPKEQQQAGDERWDKLLDDLRAELDKCLTSDQIDATVSNFAMEVKQSPDDYYNEANKMVAENRERVAQRLRNIEEARAASKVKAPEEKPAAVDPDEAAAQAEAAAEVAKDSANEIPGDARGDAAPAEGEGAPEQTGQTPEPASSTEATDGPPAPPQEAVDPDPLLTQARAKALEGRKRLNFYFAKLQPADRDHLRQFDKELYAAADAADKARPAEGA